MLKFEILMKKRWFLLIVFMLPFIVQAQKQPSVMNNVNENTVPWSLNANIYEVNIRQYTPEGTFNAFTKHLPRLKAMGVDILWLMPVYPIGRLNRKGSMGSYYSISDYQAVNPEYGTMDDFDDLVKEAHSLGMHVILDWVANHTAFDHVWTKTHPDWYNRDSTGNISVPRDNNGNLTDWTDVADLNYDNVEMRKEMIREMLFWTEQHHVDGFRCDIAGFVPLDFWQQCKAELDQHGNYFMLAEDESPEFHKNAFDMTYAWKIHHKMVDVAQGRDNAIGLAKVIEEDQKLFPKDAYRMLFIDNHDENSWQGTVKSRFGKGYQTFAVLVYTLPGMPLTYSGQESNLDKSLRFFEKDTINFKDFPLAKFYTALNTLKHRHPALANGANGGSFTLICNTQPEQILSFSRITDKDKIVVMVNLSDRFYRIQLKGNNTFLPGNYFEYFSEKEVELNYQQSLDLGPWDYKIFIKK